MSREHVHENVQVEDEYEGYEDTKIVGYSVAIRIVWWVHYSMIYQCTYRTHGSICMYYCMYVLFLIPFLNVCSSSGNLWSVSIISTNLVCIDMYGKYGDNLDIEFPYLEFQDLQHIFETTLTDWRSDT